MPTISATVAPWTTTRALISFWPKWELPCLKLIKPAVSTPAVIRAPKINTAKLIRGLTKVQRQDTRRTKKNHLQSPRRKKNIKTNHIQLPSNVKLTFHHCQFLLHCMYISTWFWNYEIPFFFLCKCKQSHLCFHICKWGERWH